ncbi:MAG: coiled-coil domain-containing protein, partial [Planctomycetota bacterium]
MRDAARSVAEDRAAPADVAQRAQALFARAEADTLIEQARATLKGSDWPSARQPIETLLGMTGLPAAASQQARELGQVLDRNLSARNVLDDVEARTDQADTTDAVAAADLMEELLARLGELHADLALAAPVRARLETAHQTASGLLDQVLPAATAAKEADRTAATDWLEQLESALDAKQWQPLEKLLTKRPRLRHWPEEMLERAEVIQRALDDHLAEQKWEDAIQSDHESAQQWVEQVRQAVAAKQWEPAEGLLSNRPKLKYWPDHVLDEANRLAGQVRSAFRKQEDQEQARQWCGQVKAAAQARDWSAAGELLAQKPNLAYWPPEVLDEVAPYRQEIDQRVEALDLQQRRAEQDARLIDAWLDKAGAAGESEHWDDALGILDTPPPVEEMPQAARDRARKLRESCRSKLAEDIHKHLQTRTQAVLELARELVRKVVEEKFARTIRPDALEVRVDADEFLTDHPSADGRALLRVRPRQAESADVAREVTTSFHFRVRKEPRGIDDDESLRVRLAGELEGLLATLQKDSIGRLETTLRQGLFPAAGITAGFTDPARSVAARVRLLDSPDEATAVEAQLEWDAARLAWTFAEPADFIRRAVQVAAVSVGAVLGEQVLERSEMLRSHRSLLGVVAVPASGQLPADLPGSVELHGRVLIRA